MDDPRRPSRLLGCCFSANRLLYAITAIYYSVSWYIVGGANPQPARHQLASPEKNNKDIS